MAEVAVVAAIHRPNLRLLRRQVESILAQDRVRLRIFAVLDGEETAENRETLEILSEARVTVIPSQQRLGIRAAFALGLKAAMTAMPQGACFAFSDQDDFWYPDKLDRSIAFLCQKNVSLVHCDARVVGEDGSGVAPSLHRFELRQEPRNLLETIVLNSVSGMTAVFTAETARLSLQLMDGLESSLLHDHVTAIAAASLHGIAHLDEALADYVQHDDNVLGAKALQQRAWYRRTPSFGGIAAYRRTSRRIYEDRRGVAQALHAAGRLPNALGPLFQVVPGLPRVILHYDAALLRMFFGGQARRGFLCLRMMDGALQSLMKR